MTSKQHETRIVHHRGWNEYTAECSCGWVGSYEAQAKYADVEAKAHVDSKKVPAIRRDGTFEYRGVRYRVASGGPYPTKTGDRYVERINSDEPGDWDVVATGFGYLSEVRDWLADAVERGYIDLDQDGATEDYFRDAR